MKRILTFVLATLMILSSFVFVSSANNVVTGITDDEWEYLKLLNDERIDKGALPLSTFAALEDVCDIRAQELVKLFSHTRPNGDFWETVLKENGIKCNVWVETSKSAMTDYKKIFDSFMANTEQHNNLDRAFFRHSAQTFYTDPENSSNVVFNNILIGGCQLKRIWLYGYDGHRMHITSGEKLSDDKYLLACECSHGISYMPLSDKMLTMDTNKVGKQTAIVKYGDKDIKVNLYVDFADVAADSWYYNYVTEAYDLGFFSGTSESEFSPNVKISRAMFVTVLARIIDFDTGVYGSAEFSDVPEDAWYSSAVAWAAKEGLVSGIGNNEFAPHEQITREQICLILSKFADKLSADMTENTEEKIFDDNDSISSWAKAAVARCQKAGMISGDQNNNFNPTEGATRAQAALMLVKFAKIVNG